MPDDRAVANQMVILREEFDDWAILFDPDTAEGYTINPTGVFIWKRLDGRRTSEEIAAELKDNSEDAPELAQLTADVREFIGDLVAKGLAGYEVEIK